MDTSEDYDPDYDVQRRESMQEIPETPRTPRTPQRLHSAYGSDLDLRARIPLRQHTSTDEYSSLLEHSNGSKNYSAIDPPLQPLTPRPFLSRHQSRKVSLRNIRERDRSNSLVKRLTRAMSFNRSRTTTFGNLEESKGSFPQDDRVWYDQFTSTDWVHDSIADAFRVKALRRRRDWRGRLYAWFDGAEGWILAAIIGFLVACMAYYVDVTEVAIFDVKEGFCKTSWGSGRKSCCFLEEEGECAGWRSWSQIVRPSGIESRLVDFVFFTGWVVVLAVMACVLALQTKTVIPSALRLSTLDENLGADKPRSRGEGDEGDEGFPANRQFRNLPPDVPPPVVFYSAAGSGVAEVKVILSGFVLHGYLGLKTLIIKMLGIILAIASGLSIGKEGPFVHIATCIGNISCRLFEKYNHNDGKRREILSAAAASGVAVAFGAPIGGVLFALEEVSYYFSPKILFRTFFCCIAAALTLKFLNPYGTNKIVLFEVRYTNDWALFELVLFAIVGCLGGLLGAMFIKASKIWATTFRRIKIIKQHPMLEIVLVALITGCMSFWNRYTKLPVTELLFELASPCSLEAADTGLCPGPENISKIIRVLGIAFVIKAFLTTITFGTKVPAGIYVPSMVVGGLMGRLIGHSIELFVVQHHHWPIFSSCLGSSPSGTCVVPGVYGLIAAGATMCGVTRLSITLAVILFELTGSLDYVLPFSVAILAAKWTADGLEPHSIYDLLLEMNSYPYLDSKVHPIFSSELGDITHRLRRDRIIDISHSPYVPATDLRAKLDLLHLAGELDSGLPILKKDILVGLIPGPDLEFALDKLEAREDDALCLMANQDRWDALRLPRSMSFMQSSYHSYANAGANGSGHAAAAAAASAARSSAHALPTHPHSDISEEEDPEADGEAGIRGSGWAGAGGGRGEEADPTDFTPYVDPAPLALEVRSPMDMVYECFVKLGLRYICVVRDGKFVGLLHKKRFVKYCKEVEEENRKEF